MTSDKAKNKTDTQLHEALKETFPASDATSTNESDTKPVRPIHRKPPRIDPGLVEELGDKAEKKLAKKARLMKI